jgi:hypothetical protein
MGATTRQAGATRINEALTANGYAPQTVGLCFVRGVRTALNKYSPEHRESVLVRAFTAALRSVRHRSRHAAARSLHREGFAHSDIVAISGELGLRAARLARIIASGNTPGLRKVMRSW